MASRRQSMKVQLDFRDIYSFCAALREGRVQNYLGDLNSLLPSNQSFVLVI